MTYSYPDEYRLLAVLQERPLHTMAALEKAGLTFTGQREPTDAQRSLIYRLYRIEQTIRIVHWAGGGYVISGIGETRLTVLEQRYGPIREEE